MILTLETEDQKGTKGMWESTQSPMSPMAKPVVYDAIFVLESEQTEDKHRKEDRQSADANDGQPSQNLRQNIDQRTGHRHHPGGPGKNAILDTNKNGGTGNRTGWLARGLRSLTTGQLRLA